MCVWHSKAQLMGTDTTMSRYHPSHVCSMACAAARQSSHPQKINHRPTALAQRPSLTLLVHFSSFADTAHGSTALSTGHASDVGPAV